MKRKVILCIAFTFMLISAIKIKAQLNLQWADSVAGNVFYAISSVQTDISGNVYITGTFNDTSDFDPGPGIVYLVPYSYSQNIFIAKYNKFGNYIWAKSMGADSVDAGGMSLYVDVFGNAYTCGYFGDTIDFDPGPGIQNLISNGIYDIFIAKYDSSGNYLWAENIGGKYQDDIYGIDGDDYGNIYITGRFADTVDFDPGLPVFNLIGFGNAFWMFIAKYDSNGNFSWAKSAGTGVGRGIDVNAAGISYITGNYGSSVMIAKYDSAGSNVWLKAIAGGSTTGRSIDISVSGSVFIMGDYTAVIDLDPGSGTANIFSNGSYDFFIARYDSLGNYVYGNGFGSSGQELSMYIQVDALDNVYCTGNLFGNNIDFNPGLGIDTLSGTHSCIFIAKYDPLGNFIWVNEFLANAQSWSNCLKVDEFNNVYITGLNMGPIDMDLSAGVAKIYQPGVFFAKYSQNSVGIIEQFSISNFTITPNPFTTTLTIKGTTQKGELIIFDITGKEVLHTKTFSGETTINTAHLTPGFYFINYREGDKTVNKKAVKAP